MKDLTIISKRDLVKIRDSLTKAVVALDTVLGAVETTPVKQKLMRKSREKATTQVGFPSA